MAKNFNSVSFTILVLVLMMASTGILKTKALPGVECPVGSGCLVPSTRVFTQECGPEPFLGTDLDCCACCTATYGSPPVCFAVVEGTDLHCHCYQKKP
ncbi:unnamed protein product [Brassica oleracea var. botrytis]|uniref:Uncharacterized protein n=3 Tax=Brassica TaxID=3705 RepID=A0A8S9II04_BRACR|nr:hypothetical protein F2Q68_00026991 [Brassica cretica]CAF1859437.1 unnamed protein product [Brassica napus]CDY46405.1 BnaC04g33240D [Brassica napus]VDD11948.1 unnamed protein product [Brassica oleracea]